MIGRGETPQKKGVTMTRNPFLGEIRFRSSGSSTLSAEGSPPAFLRATVILGLIA